MTRRSVLLLAVALASAAAAAPAPVGAAPKRPNLSVSGVSGAPVDARPGTEIQVTVKVRNGGGGKGGASTAELVLSADKRRDPKDVVLGTASIKALAKGKTVSAKLRGRIPAKQAAATYSLLACADVRKKVKESSEKDNCRVGAALKVLQVLPVGPPEAPPQLFPGPGPGPGPAPEPTATPTATPTPPAAAIPALTVNDAIADEGDSGVRDLVVEVHADRAAANDVSAAIRVESDSATVGTDVEALDGRVVIPAGAVNATVTVRVIGDVVDEPDERVRIVLSNPQGATLARATATGTIRDDDDPPAGPPAVSVDDVAIAEGNSGQRPATFTLRFSRPLPAAGSVRVKTAADTATPGVDFTGVDRVVDLAAGSEQAQVEVQVLGDTDVEPEETFRLELSEPNGVTVATTAATARIQNDDQAPQAPDAPGTPVLETPDAPEEILTGTAAEEAPAAFDQAVEFLYTGASAPQKAVAADAIKPQRASVVRGRVVRANGAAIAGAKISVHDHPELGFTASRDDGRFDLAINGGDETVLSIERAGYMPIQRTLDHTGWGEYGEAGDLILRPYNPDVDAIDLDATTPQLAEAPAVTDEAGTRRSSLLFMPGTEAEAKLPDGTTVDLGSLSVRSTEYTSGGAGPEGMPGDLPATSGYTYAVELSADEAVRLGATSVEFDRPVINYTDNFIGFPAGTPVPTGYYDRDRGLWVASKNGLVMDVAGEHDGLADIDVTGDGVADAAAVLITHGIEETERRRLAQRYDAGASLWRVEVTHFTPWDHNFPYGPPEDAEEPCKGNWFSKALCESGRWLKKNLCSHNGSIIDCQRQSLRERFPVRGTPYSLNYSSERTPGRAADYEAEATVSGPSVPASLKRIRVTLAVAGRTIEKVVAPAPNQKVTLRWDGLDAYGRRLTAPAKAKLTIAYVYPLVYQAPATFSQSFARISGRPMGIDRAGFEIESLDEQELTLGTFDAARVGLGGLTLDIHDTYDPATNTVFFGDGTTQTAEGGYVQSLAPFAGTGTVGTTGDEGPALSARLSSPRGLAAGPDGSTYVVDSENDRIRVIDRSGVIRAFAGTDVPGFSGDGGAAKAARLSAPAAVALLPEGGVLIADSQNNRVRLVTSDGRISTVAGGGAPADGLGDGGPATSARLRAPAGVAPAPGGGFYVADSNTHRVRFVGPDGIISTVIGTGLPGSGDGGGVAAAAEVNRPTALALDPLGRLLIADGGNRRVVRVGIDGRYEVFAGGGTPADGVGDGGRATEAALLTPAGLAATADGDVLIVDRGSGRLRRVYSDGGIGTVAGSASSPTSGTAAGSRLSAPEGVAVQPDGRIVIAERDAHRLVAIGGRRGIDEGDVLVPTLDGGELLQFRPDGRHARTLNALTGAVVRAFAYDSAGRLTSITEDGNATTIERDAATGAPKAIVGPYGARTELTLDGQGWLKTIKSPAGQLATLTIAADGLLRRLDRGGATHEYEYDSGGRLTLDKGPKRVQHLSRTTDGETEEITLRVEGGSTTVYRTTNTREGVITRSKTVDGLVETSSVEQPDGTYVVSDSQGVQSSGRTVPDQRFGDKRAMPDQELLKTAGGRQLTTTRSQSAVRSSSPFSDPFDFTSLEGAFTIGNRSATGTFVASTKTLTSRTSAGRNVAMSYDASGRLATTRMGDRAAVQYAYDDKGRVKTITQDGDATTVEYGTDGVPNLIRDAAGQEKRMARDADGRLTQVTGKGWRTVDFTYDAGGRVSSVKPAGRGAQTFTYNADGSQASATLPPPSGSGAGTTTNWDYDDAGRVTKVRKPGRDAMDLAYGDGLLTSVKAGGRLLTGMERDPATGALKAVAGPDARVVLETDGPLNLSETWSGTVAGVLRRTYDTQLRPTETTWKGQRLVDFEYDADGLVRRAGAVTITRSATTGAPSGTTIGTLATSLERAASGEVNRLATTSGTDTIFDEKLTRDAIGRVTRSEVRIGTATTVTDYRFDAAGQLDEVKRDGAVIATYGYDGHGNRTSVKESGRPDLTAAYDGQDRVTTHGEQTLAWRDDGTLASRAVTGTPGSAAYDFDERGQLRGVTLADGSTVAYNLDGTGRRIGRRFGGTVTGWVYAQEGRGPVAEVDDNGNLVSAFAYGSRTAVPDTMVKGGKTYQLITDHLGSVRLVVDVATRAIAQRIDYDAWGRVTSDSNPGFQPFGFAGGMYDPATGLVRFDAREYDASLGRWLARDPIGLSGEDTNLYLYVGNDPVSLRDPSGQMPLAVAAVGAGAIGCAVGAAKNAICGGSVLGGCAVGAVSAVVGTLAWAGVAAGLGAVGVSAGVSAAASAVVSAGASNAASQGTELLTDQRDNWSWQDWAEGTLVDSVLGFGLHQSGAVEALTRKVLPGGRYHPGPMPSEFKPHSMTPRRWDYVIESWVGSALGEGLRADWEFLVNDDWF